MTKLAIIGTAGRGDDAAKLTIETWDRMIGLSRQIVSRNGITHAVSGGAAWADHVVVGLGLIGVIPPENITLHLPAELDGDRFFEAGSGGYNKSAGRTANYYHGMFSKKLDVNSLEQIIELKARGATCLVNPRGFKARNTDVARDVSPHGLLLAFTFGSSPAWVAQKHGPSVKADDAGLKDGGTADTWNKAYCPKIHACLA